MSIEQEIVKVEQKLYELHEKLKQERLALLLPDQQLAVKLHEALCAHNHTDGCSWFYDTCQDGQEDWERHTHGVYLKKAQNLLAFCKTKGVKPEDVIRHYQTVTTL